jgi:hypothetical protein
MSRKSSEEDVPENNNLENTKVANSKLDALGTTFDSFRKPVKSAFEKQRQSSLQKMSFHKN